MGQSAAFAGPITGLLLQLSDPLGGSSLEGKEIRVALPSTADQDSLYVMPEKAI